MLVMWLKKKKERNKGLHHSSSSFCYFSANALLLWAARRLKVLAAVDRSGSGSLNEPIRGPGIKSEVRMKQ